MKNILFGLAWRITQNRTEAEDIVQDVLLKMWDLRNEWNKMESIGAYCMAMAKHKALDKVKNKNFSTQKIDINGIGHYTDNNNPHRETESREQLSMIQKILAGLPEKQQQVMQLREFEEKNYQEIAAMLNITEEQVKINLFRARQKMKQELQKINSYGI